MNAYLIIDLQITDLEGFMAYVQRIPEMIARHGGRYLVEGVVPDVIEGNVADGHRSVVLQFPSQTAAKAFLAERANSDLHSIWAATTTSRILLVDGADEARVDHEGG